MALENLSKSCFDSKGWWSRKWSSNHGRIGALRLPHKNGLRCPACGRRGHW